METGEFNAANEKTVWFPTEQRSRLLCGLLPPRGREAALFGRLHSISYYGGQARRCIREHVISSAYQDPKERFHVTSDKVLFGAAHHHKVRSGPATVSELGVRFEIDGCPLLR